MSLPDAVCLGIATRVRREVGDVQLRSIDGTNGVNGNLDRDLMTVGFDGTRENGERRQSSEADEGLGIED